MIHAKVIICATCQCSLSQINNTPVNQLESVNGGGCSMPRYCNRGLLLRSPPWEKTRYGPGSWLKGCCDDPPSGLVICSIMKYFFTYILYSDFTSSPVTGLYQSLPNTEPTMLSQLNGCQLAEKRHFKLLCDWLANQICSNPKTSL